MHFDLGRCVVAVDRGSASRVGAVGSKSSELAVSAEVQAHVNNVSVMTKTHK